MARDFPMIEVGEEIRCEHFNVIYRELNRWRRMTGSGLVDVDSADGSAPPTISGHATVGRYRIWMPTGIAAGTFGTPAVKDDVILAVASGDGWTTTGGGAITLLNCDTTPITGAKSGWAFLRADGKYELAIGDC